ncbi:MAG: hypothetical protein QXH67_06240 [Candidatus Bathyarchaeia archaeon]
MASVLEGHALLNYTHPLDLSRRTILIEKILPPGEDPIITLTVIAGDYNNFREINEALESSIRGEGKEKIRWWYLPLFLQDAENLANSILSLIRKGE